MKAAMNRRVPVTAPGSGISPGPFFYLRASRSQGRRDAERAPAQRTRIRLTDRARAEIERAIDSVNGAEQRRRYEWLKKQAKETPRSSLEVVPVGISRIAALQSPERCSGGAG